MTLRVSDHALVRFLERAGGLDTEGLRTTLAASLDRAHALALAVGADGCAIVADGLIYVVQDRTVVTICSDRDGAKPYQVRRRSKRTRRGRRS